ncbi:DUF1364 domain-containing protein [Pasteurellaceae bacterium HPA106]|uniref:DUF1364 domain-containing protein n=1 Tax=Spirabiliibacterium pneumoniae TaxID=221400 RepID=UPI001AADE0A4|nr:DUF1364 domain-containing protein [Spirabiliibacterium pneumoniae]MBE2895725.1 DUF1364 domain-containing protein [Spirabiliibacterium pneumoniae]
MAKTNLRKEAKQRDCQVRIAGVCNHNPETTVLAHYRLKGQCGVGMKPVDLCGAWACSACHDVIDGRVKTDIDKLQRDLDHANGTIRTIIQLFKEGKIIIV